MDDPSHLPYVCERVWPISDASSKAPPAFDPKHAREEMTPERQWCGPLNVNNLPPKAPQLPWWSLRRDAVGNPGYTTLAQPAYSYMNDEERGVYEQHHSLGPEIRHTNSGPYLELPEVTLPHYAENELAP